MAETLIEEKKKSPRKFGPLLVGLGISFLWGLFTAQYLFRNFEEISKLPSNSIGDVLAGFFAPLAFLWLFVATLLQRQELELQRAELTETRKVLAQQREEMEKAAKENLEQTKIMKQNLENDFFRSQYDHLDTFLYATALYIFTNRHLFKIRGNDQSNFEYIAESDLSQFEISKISFDGIYVAVLSSLRRSIKIINRNPTIWSVIGSEHEQIARETHSRLKQILELGQGENTLIRARLEGLGFEELVKLFRSVQRFEIPE